jgi:hypothetical protein
MLRKDGKFYADWYDADGKRRAKSFGTPLEAQRYEHRMDTLAHAVRLGRTAALAVHYTRRKQVEIAELLNEAHELAKTTAAALAVRHDLTGAQVQELAAAHQLKRNAHRRIARRNRRTIAKAHK